MRHPVPGGNKTSIKRRVPFGIGRDGRLVDAASTDRGLACDCICPGCRTTLVANQGLVRVPYFSHYSNVDCTAGAETAIHLAAKQVLIDRLQILLPPLRVQICRKDPKYGIFSSSRNLSSSLLHSFQSASPEISLGDIRPDVLAVNHDGTNIALEIRVTHAVDALKAARLRSLDLACIEIDLRSLIGTELSMRDLEREVIESTSNKQWIFHPQIPLIEASLLSEFDAWQASKQDSFEVAKERKAEEIAAPKTNSAAVIRRTERVTSENYVYSLLPDAEKLAQIRATLGLVGLRWPSHLAVGLRADMSAIPAPKNLWQGAIFARFIYRVGQNRELPEIRNLTYWVTQRFGLRSLSTDRANAAVFSYLAYLTACGFLERRGRIFRVVHDGLYPPSRPPRPDRPASQTGDCLSQVVQPHFILPIEAAHSILKWSALWPDEVRLHSWLRDFALKRCPDLNVEVFLWHLLRSQEEPTEEDMLDLLFHSGGEPELLGELLRHCALTIDTSRVIYSGELPPWRQNCC